MSGETDNQPLAAQLVAEEPDENETILEIEYGGGTKTLAVTRKAKKSMAASVDASANQPTLFFRWRYVGQAIADILKRTLVDFSFAEQPNNIDWDAVLPGHKDAYPKAATPDEDTFGIVQTVHILVKKEKDADARAIGLPKSGVQSYITYKQKWKSWRDVCYLFHAMNKEMAPETILDLIQGLLKLCASKEAIDEVICCEVKRYKERLKREARKRAAAEVIDTALDKLVRDEERADRAVEIAMEFHGQALEKRREFQVKEYEGSRTQRKTARAAALKAVEEEETIAFEDLEKAQQEQQVLSERKRELEQQKQQASLPLPAEPRPTRRKKAKRTNIALLNEKPTPREKVNQEGDGWKPPMKVGSRAKYDDPGNKWRAESETKVQLLVSLAHHLQTEGKIQQPMTFIQVMEFIGADQRERDDEAFDFSAKVFAYIVALTLGQYM